MYDEISVCPSDDALLADVRSRAIDTDPVYIVFTSGSTGVPKGVVGCHRAVIDYVENLMEVLQVPDYKADMCTAFAQGNLGKAIMLANSEHFNEIREEAIQLLKYIHEMELSELAQAVSRITTYKLEITDYLDIIMIWYRDVLLYKATKEVDKVIFKEQISFIKEQARKSSYEGIETILKALETAKARLKANVNFDLVMELLFLTIKEN